MRNLNILKERAKFMIKIGEKKVVVKNCGRIENVIKSLSGISFFKSVKGFVCDSIWKKMNLYYLWQVLQYEL